MKKKKQKQQLPSQTTLLHHVHLMEERIVSLEKEVKELRTMILPRIAPYPMPHPYIDPGDSFPGEPSVTIDWPYFPTIVTSDGILAK